MKVMTKKQDHGKVIRLETSGEIKEVRINEDILNPEGILVTLCFRDKENSGIVELTQEEINFISKKISPKIKLVKDIKVMKFKK